MDSSSFSVHGQYNQVLSSDLESQEKESEIEPIPISITHGYSRDHRPDLKQFVLDLIVTGDGNIPVFIEAASGNQSDKKAFGQIAKNYKKQLKLETTIVGDSALYSKDNLVLLREIQWLTRVPLSIKEAKNLVNELSASEFSPSEIPGYWRNDKEAVITDNCPQTQSHREFPHHLVVNFLSFPDTQARIHLQRLP